MERQNAGKGRDHGRKTNPAPRAHTTYPNETKTTTHLASSTSSRVLDARSTDPSKCAAPRRATKKPQKPAGARAREIRENEKSDLRLARRVEADADSSPSILRAARGERYE